MQPFSPRLRFGVSVLLAALAVAAPARADDIPAPAPAPTGPTLVPVPLEGQFAPPADPAPVTPEPTATVERVAAPTATPERPEAGDPGLDISELAVPAIALVALGLGFLAGSRRRHAAPRSPAAPPASSALAAPPPTVAPRRRRIAITPDKSLPSSGRAVVHSELDPDGYVELEGCLRRARWAAPGEPPAVGAHVRVELRGDRLVAHGGRSR